MKITLSVFSLLQERGRCLFSLCLMLLVLLPMTAEADRELSLRYSANIQGDVAWIGNVNLTCPAGTSCTNALNGSDAAGRNDNFNMTNLDMDGVAGTTNSSAAILTLPAGATVEYARLYWSARRSSSAASRAAVSFRSPAMGGYSSLTAESTDYGSVLGTSNYQSMVDVTTQVRAAGSGTYWVANVHSSTGDTVDYAGWALVVVYSDANQALRNLTLFDGLKSVQDSSTSFTVSGFLTPYNGPVITRLGVLAYEGDRPTAADYVRVNNNDLSNAANPANNFFNATISNFGQKVTTSTPSYDNNLQIDIDLLNVPTGIVTNASTSANISIGSSSSNEAFALAAASFSTELYVPVVVPNVVKTAQDMSPSTPLLRGDTLRWNVVMSNTGYDSATNLIATDIIPAWLTYVPGSMRISSGANSSPPTKTDATSDDQADFLVGPNRVVFRLGAGANGTQGGTLAYGQSTSFYFDTIVNSDTPAGTSISNEVQVQYNSQTLPATTFAASSAAATATVMGPPVIAKSFNPTVVDTGQSSVMTITISNPASNPQTLTGVTFTDTYPSGMVNAATPNAQVNCTPGSSAGTVTGATAGSNSIGMSPGASLAANGSCIITVNVTSATVGSYLNTISNLNSTNGGPGNTASATLFVGRPRITKAFSASSINSGSTSVITFTLQNLANTALTQVEFSDPLSNMIVATTPAATNTCNGTLTASGSSIALAAGSLSANGSCTITVPVTSTIGGVHPNTTTGVSSFESGAAGQPSNTAMLTVIGPPTISKSFLPLSVRRNSASTMTIVVTNPNPSAVLNSVSFTDTYPTNLVNSSPSAVQSSCTASSSVGTLTAASGGGSVSMSGGSLAAGGSCTITVNVQSGTVNTYTNTISNVSGNAGFGALTGVQASAALVVAERLSASKVVATTPATTPVVNIPYNTSAAPTSAELTITIAATSGAQVTGVNFDDAFPSGLVVASTPAASATCGTLQGQTGTSAWGGVATGNTAIRLINGNINGSGSCVIKVAVTSTSTAKYTNTLGTVYSSNGGTATAPASAVLDVLGPPQISKSFSATTIPVRSNNNNFAVMTITISNPTTATVGLAGLAFDDIFPAGMAVRTGSGNQGVNNACGGTFTGSANGGASWRTPAGINASDNAIRLTGGSLAAGASCNLTVSVQGTTAGEKENTTTAITSSNGGTGSTASATLWVGAPPTVVKSFTCTQPIRAGDSCAMTLAITAPSGGVALSQLEITDIFPLELANGGEFTLFNTTLGRSANCPAAGTFTFEGRTGSNAAWTTAVAGNTAVRISTTGSITAGNTCTLTINVTSTLAATNTIRVGDLTGLYGSGATSNAVASQATLQVYATPQVEKSFAASSILLGSSTQMTISITNLNGVAVSGVAFDDLFPAATSPSVGQMTLANNTVSNSCNGSVSSRNASTGTWRAAGTVVAGDTGLRLTGGSLVTGVSDCAITANITSTAAGSYTNTIAEVNSTTIGKSGPVSATLRVMAPPTLAKAFTPNSILVNENSLLTITLTNPNTATGAVITGAALTDAYPSGLVNSATPNASTSCPGATLTAAAGGNSVAISGATIPANGSCTISVQVTSSSANTYTNSTGALTTTNAGNAAAASAVLTVTPYMPSLSLTKLVSVVSDPLNGVTNPKYIPGAVAAYSVRMSNSGQGSVDDGTIRVRDTLPEQVELFVGAGSGAAVLLQGFSFSGSTTPASGLTCTFGARNANNDCIEFSADGVNFIYTPAPNADGYDPNIKAIEFRPGGVFNPSGGGNPWAEFQFRVRVK